QIADFKLQISNCRFQIADFKLQIADCRFQTQLEQGLLPLPCLRTPAGFTEAIPEFAVHE
ncbi:hypothetical protein KQI65_13595, partial [bacterium]|nr:hypothetical protein [bacterium]